MHEYTINYRQTEYRTARIKADSMEAALDTFIHGGERDQDWFDSADDTEIISITKQGE